MATLTKYPTGNSSNSWNNPSYAYVTGDTQYADCTPATNGGTVSGDWGTFDFSAIPSGSTINDVYMQHSTWKTSGSRSGFRVDLEMYDGSTKIGNTVTGSELGSTTYPSAITADQGTHPTLAQLQSANFKVRVIGVNTNTKYTLGIDMDYVRVYVDYTAPSAKSGGTQTIYAVADSDHSSTQPVRIRRPASITAKDAVVDADHSTTLRNRIRGTSAIPTASAVCVAPTIDSSMYGKPPKLAGTVTLNAVVDADGWLRKYVEWTVVRDNLVGEWNGYLAKDRYAAGNNSDPTGVWRDWQGNYDGTLQTFSYSDPSFWTGSGTFSDPTCLSFDGSSDRVDLPSLQVSDDRVFSYEIWVRCASIPGNNANIINETTDDSFAPYAALFIATSSGYARFTIHDGTTQSNIFGTVNLCDNEWHHIVATCDTSYLRLYVDGASANTPQAAPSNNFVTNWTTFGVQRYSSGPAFQNYFGGDLAAVRLYSDTLSDAEVLQNYQAGPLGTASVKLAGTVSVSAVVDSDHSTTLRNRVRRYTTHRNLHLNPGFVGDGDVDGLADQWLAADTVVGTPTYSLESLGDGRYRQRIQYTAVSGDVDTAIFIYYNTPKGSVQQGDVVRCEGLMTANPSNSGVQLVMNVGVKDSGDVTLVSGWWNNVTSGVLYRNTLVCPAGASYVTWRFYANDLDYAAADVADITVAYPLLETSGEDVDYYDGDTSGCYWQGTQYAAISVKTPPEVVVVASTASGGKIKRGVPALASAVVDLDHSATLRNRVRRYNSATNLVKNPGMVGDSNLDGIPDGWTLFENVVGTPTFTLTDIGDGRYRVRFQYTAVSGDVNTALGIGISSDIGSVEPGDAVLFRALETTNPSNSGCTPNLSVYVREAGYPATTFAQLTPTSGVVKWIGLNAPANSSYAEVRLYAFGIDYATGDVVDMTWELPAIYRNGEQITYFDGESSGCYWAGTQYASTSIKTPPEVVVASSTASGGKIRRGAASVSAVVDLDHSATLPRRTRGAGTTSRDLVVDADSTATVTKIRRGITTAQSLVVAHEAAGSKVSGEVRNGEADVSLCVDADANFVRIRKTGTQTVVACVDADTVARRVRAAGTATVSAPVDADVTVVGRLRKAGTQTVSACVDADSTATVTRIRKGITTAQSAVVVHNAAGTLLGVKSAGTQTIAAVSDCDHASTQPLRIRRPGTQTLVTVVDADTTANKVRLGTTLAQSAVAAQGSVSGTRRRLATPDAKYAVVDADYAPLPVRIRKPAAVPEIAAVVVHGAVGGEVGKATAIVVAVVDADTPQPTRIRIVSNAGTHSAAVDADTTALRIKRSGTQTVSLVVDADTTALRIKRAGTQTISSCVDCDYSPLPTRIRRGLVQAVSAPVDADAGTVRRIRLGSVSAKSLVVDADAGTPVRTRRGITVAQSAVVTHTAAGSKLGIKNGAANVSLCVDADSVQPRRTRGAGTLSRSLVVDADTSALRIRRPVSLTTSAVVSHTGGARRVRGCTVAAQSAVVTHTAGARRTRGAGTALRSAVVTITGSGSTGVTTKTAGTRSLGAVVSSSGTAGRTIHRGAVRTSCHVTVAEYGSYAPPVPAGRLTRERPPLWIDDFKRTGRLR